MISENKKQFFRKVLNVTGNYLDYFKQNISDIYDEKYRDNFYQTMQDLLKDDDEFLQEFLSKSKPFIVSNKYDCLDIIKIINNIIRAQLESHDKK